MSKKRLVELCEVIVPMRDKPKTFVTEEKGIPWCRIEDIEGKFLNGSKSEKYVSNKCIEQMHLKLFPAGTVLCAVTGASIGTYAITTRELITNQTFAGLVCKDNLLYNEFLYYYIKMHTNTFINKSVGCAQAYITRETLENMLIPDLEYNEQVKLVKVLKHLDDKININNNINAVLEAMARTIYDYWFMQFDFPNEDGKPYKSSGGKMVWNEELRREIPEGWNSTTLANIANCFDSYRIPLSNAERENRKGNIPYYGATGIMDYVDEALFDGDYVLMAEDGSVMDEKGRPILQRITGKVWVNNHAHVLKPSKKHGCKLLMMLLKDVPVMKIKTGSIQMKINQENMNKIELPEIPDKLIDSINVILNDIDTQILHRESENQELASLRDFLLPLLMNGQVVFREC